MHRREPNLAMLIRYIDLSKCLNSSRIPLALSFGAIDKILFCSWVITLLDRLCTSFLFLFSYNLTDNVVEIGLTSGSSELSITTTRSLASRASLQVVRNSG